MFEPIAVETMGVFNGSAIPLLNDLGRRISSISGDTRETSHLYQRVSVLMQRFNATQQPAGPWLHGLSIIPFQ